MWLLMGTVTFRYPVFSSCDEPGKQTEKWFRALLLLPSPDPHIPDDIRRRFFRIQMGKEPVFNPKFFRPRTENLGKSMV
jgi:hypothetical protein